MPGSRSRSGSQYFREKPGFRKPKPKPASNSTLALTETRNWWTLISLWGADYESVRVAPNTQRWNSIFTLACFRDNKSAKYSPESIAQPLTLAGTDHFAILDGMGGGGRPLCVSKLSVVSVAEKKNRIALDEYSRMAVPFLILGKYLT